ncbi:MAG TPA: hypothetical protein VFI73_12555 [Candidatus Nitrosopolaris sp.]|nr:hypothetical protein [Candidatus Nitrosopolaris sp.]
MLARYILLNSSLEIHINEMLVFNVVDSKLFTFRLQLTKTQQKEVQTYLESLSVNMILFGLRFAYKRERALTGGYLMPGRKSIVKKETVMLNNTQAGWRLNNWKAMIRSYREKGYSYPTISRIKKEIRVIAHTNK